MQNVITPLTQVDDTQQHELGMLAEDAEGNTYVYAQGVALTEVGSAVTITSANLTALLVGNGVGPVGFAMGAILANQFGWYLRSGNGFGIAAAATADNAPLYGSATAGEVADAVVVGDMIVNAFSTTAPGATGPVGVRCYYPFVTGTLG